MSRTMDYARLLAGFVVPYNVVEFIRDRRARRRLAADNAKADEFKRAVRERKRPAAADYNWADAHSFLSGLGCDRKQVGDGSISEQSLVYSCKVLEQHVKSRPVVGLHIGNFVGISLCHYVDFVRRLDENSVVVSIDPNLTHRGIHNPLDKVISCLNHFGLQSNAIILTGFSLEKSVSNDGVKITPDYDPAIMFNSEMSCENQLPMLVRLMPDQFDFAVIDGNHEGSYLTREIDLIYRLLKPNGILVADDVNWNELGRVYATLNPERFEPAGSDGRVGLAKKK